MTKLELENKSRHFKGFSESYRNINEMVTKCITRLYLDGVKQNTRNGQALCLYDQEIILLNPLARHLSLKGRTNNIFGTIGEMFWVMSGNNRIQPMLEFFVPRAPNYSDDGKTWHASYGDRLWNYKQVHHAVKMFSEDGLLTRRSTQSIFIPELDAYDNYMKAEGSMKDVPCNQWINYYIQKVDNKYYFNMKTTQRSGDLIFGTGNINLPEFTLIQEMMLSMISEIYQDEEIHLGVYKHIVTNLHIYDALEKQFNDIINGIDYNTNTAIPMGDDFLSAKFPSIFKTDTDVYDVYIIRNFFQEIAELLEKAITLQGNQASLEDTMVMLKNIFQKYLVTTENNSIYAYAVLCLYYIFGKRFGNIKIKDFFKTLNITHQDKSIAGGLYFAVMNNKFRSFEIETFNRAF